MDFDYSGLATANEKLTGLADQVRNVTGETSTLSIEGMAEALAALNLINYGTVKAGSTSIPATTQGDTLSLVAGTGITLTGDATNKKITISSSSSSGPSNATLVSCTNNTTTTISIPEGSFIVTDFTYFYNQSQLINLVYYYKGGYLNPVGGGNVFNVTEYHANLCAGDIDILMKIVSTGKISVTPTTNGRTLTAKILHFRI